MLNLPVTCTPSTWVEDGKQRRMLKVKFSAYQTGQLPNATSYFTTYQVDLRAYLQQAGMKDIKSLQWDGVFPRYVFLSGTVSEFWAGAPFVFAGVTQPWNPADWDVNPDSQSGERFYTPMVRVLEWEAETGQKARLCEGADSVVPLFSRGVLELKVPGTSPTTPPMTELEFFVFDFVLPTRYAIPAHGYVQPRFWPGGSE